MDRTDFFHLNDQNARKIGFPAGVARKVTLQVFDRYERQSRFLLSSNLIDT